MLISIASPTAKCNEPEHIVATNAKKYLFAKKRRHIIERKIGTIATFSHAEVEG